ncbi:MAG: hypothetical protein HPY83_01425 [Anaerolineae bacterium]|nr:hypothetical protein [Anaerolineae bacterium]
MGLATRDEVLPRLREAAGHRILVVGDVVLDRYVIGCASRLSREAPVPVLVHEESFSLPGSAANPALNIRALQSQAVQVAVIGDDDAGSELLGLLESAGVEASSVLRVQGRRTTVKQRILARASLLYPQQMARVDYLESRPIPAPVLDRLAEEVTARSTEVEAILISDYQGGTVGEAVLAACLRARSESGLPLCVDAQDNLWRYRGVTLVKCNRDEASRALGQSLTDEAGFRDATARIMDRIEADVVAITRGGDGMSLRDARGGYYHLPAPNRSDVYDVVGAGDTVIAIMTLGVVAGWPPRLAATVAQLGSGIVIQRLGNATPSYEELEEAANRWL